MIGIEGLLLNFSLYFITFWTFYVLKGCFNKEIEKLEKVDILEIILTAIKTVNTIENLREIYQNHPSFSK